MPDLSPAKVAKALPLRSFNSVHLNVRKDGTEIGVAADCDPQQTFCIRTPHRLADVLHPGYWQVMAGGKREFRPGDKLHIIASCDQPEIEYCEAILSGHTKEIGFLLVPLVLVTFPNLEAIEDDETVAGLYAAATIRPLIAKPWEPRQE